MVKMYHFSAEFAWNNNQVDWMSVSVHNYKIIFSCCPLWGVLLF